MKKVRIITASVMFVTTMNSCKSRRESDAALNETSTRRKIDFLFVVAQGFYSCTYRLRNTRETIHNLTTDAIKNAPKSKRYSTSVTIIEPCFSGGLVENAGAEKLHYTITRPGEDTGDKREISVDALNYSIGSIANGANNENPMYVYLIGHSHGGWLVMNSALNWRSKGILRGLFTIDPISYKNCTQLQGIAYHLVMGLNLLGFENPECTRAPTDLVNDYPKIAENSNRIWHNYYQTQFSYVHSGPAEGATTNRELKFTYPYVDLIKFAHRDILGDDRVWSSIKNVISSDIHNVFESLN